MAARHAAGVPHQGVATLYVAALAMIMTVVALLSFGAVSYPQLAAGAGAYSPLHAADAGEGGGTQEAPAGEGAPDAQGVPAGDTPTPAAPPAPPSAETLAWLALPTDEKIARAEAAVDTSGCPGCCARFAALLGTYEGFHEGSMSNLWCIRFSKQKGAVQMRPFGNWNPVYGYYLKFAAWFLGEVLLSGWLERGGEAVWAITDVAEVPSELAAAACALRIPVLAHSVLAPGAPHLVWVPDFHFIEHRGYADTVAKVEEVAPGSYRERAPQVFWRGSTTGLPGCILQGEEVGDGCQVGCEHNPRRKVIEEVNRIHKPWLNVSLSNPVDFCGDADRESNPELYAEGVREPGWARYRGVLELDGYVNAWGGRWRAESGSVVFRVETNWDSMYTREMEPNVHYIPIKGDLSDLGEATNVVTSQKEEDIERMEGVARASRNLMRSRFTYDQVVRRVARKLSAAWHDGTVDTYEHLCPPPDKGCCAATASQQMHAALVKGMGDGRKLPSQYGRRRLRKAK